LIETAARLRDDRYFSRYRGFQVRGRQ